jgi:lysylphosphatidylglycerol synthetase-like protein (DUF2156 family)
VFQQTHGEAAPMVRYSAGIAGALLVLIIGLLLRKRATPQTAASE